jgi:hypothetical protein
MRFGPNSVRLPEPFTFFLDRSLGGEIVATALRSAGERAVAHDDHFADDEPDVAWLRQVGENGWVVLTKDAHIRTNALERQALLTAGVAAFMLGRGDVKGPQMAEAFVKALPRMKKVLRRWEVPIIATVSIDGAVAVLFANGSRLDRPRSVK